MKIPNISKAAVLIALILLTSGVTASEESITCSGTVLGPDNQPVKGAKVILYEVNINRELREYDIIPEEKQTTSDDGKFSFTVQGGQRTTRPMAIITAQKPGLSIDWFNWQLRDNIQENIILTRPAALAGKVISPDGQPVPDAKVRILLLSKAEINPADFLFGFDPLEGLTTRTDSNGEFRFETLPENSRAELAVTESGFAHSTNLTPQIYREGLTYKAAQTDIEIQLSRPAVIEGKVVHGETGEGISGVTVFLSAQNQGLNLLQNNKAITEADGSFKIDGIPAGDYETKCISEETDLVFESQTLALTPDQTEKDIRLEASTGTRLEILVKDPQDQPLKNAQVVISNTKTNSHIAKATDANGIAGFALSPAEYQLQMVYHQEYSSQRNGQIITIEPGEEKHMEIKLEGTPTLTGTVYGPDGEPASDVELKIIPYSQNSVKSDANGKFEIKMRTQYSSGQMPLYLSGRDKQNNLAATEQISSDANNVDLKLSEGLIITGQVVDPNKKSLGNANVNLMVQLDRFVTNLQQQSVDDSGNFEIRALPAGFEYRVRTSCEGYGRNTITVTREKGEIDLGKIELRLADMKIAGRVINIDEEPISGVVIRTHGEGQPNKEAESDPNGYFEISGVCEGEVRLSLRIPDKNIWSQYNTKAGTMDNVIIMSSEQQRWDGKEGPKSTKGQKLDLPETVKLPVASDFNSTTAICLWDVMQRPSRHFIRELWKKSQKTETDTCRVITVAAVPGNFERAKEWMEKEGIELPTGQITGKQEETLDKMGVASLPWIILVDSDGVIKEEGNGNEHLDTIISVPEK